MTGPWIPPFESEVVFPDEPYAAAWMYFGVMAYPELGAGQPNGRGSEFADSLRKFAIWGTKKSRGISHLRNILCDPTYKAPQKREFDGIIERGVRRVFRRLAAYDLVGTQLLNGFFAVRALGSRALREGRGQEAFHLMENGELGPARQELWQEATPSTHQVLRRSLEHWSTKFALNTTGTPADINQKAKDLNRRAFQTSIPVLHMAHGLSSTASQASKKISGWNERNPVLALVLNAELWVWDAVEAAEIWRLTSQYMPQDYLEPSRMVKLKRS
jgi:hypothetical protein